MHSHAIPAGGCRHDGDVLRAQAVPTDVFPAKGRTVPLRPGPHPTHRDQGTGSASPVVLYRSTPCGALMPSERRHPFGHREAPRPTGPALA